MIAKTRKVYYCHWMKKGISNYIASCLECKWVKVEHKNLGGFLEQIQILEWKWEIIFMDLTIGTPRIGKKNDLLMVVVDNLSETTNLFLLNYPQSS